MEKEEYRGRMAKRFLELGVKKYGLKKSAVLYHLDRAWDYAIWHDEKMKNPELEADYYFNQEIKNQ